MAKITALAARSVVTKIPARRSSGFHPSDFQAGTASTTTVSHTRVCRPAADEVLAVVAVAAAGANRACPR